MIKPDLIYDKEQVGQRLAKIHKMVRSNTFDRAQDSNIHELHMGSG